MSLLPPKRTYYIHWQQDNTTFGGCFSATSRFKWLAKLLAHRKLSTYRAQRSPRNNFLRITRESWK